MYRVEFCTPDHIEIVDWLDNPLTAKEYVSEVDNFAAFMNLKKEGYGMPSNKVIVKIINNKNNHVISEYQWKGTNDEI